MGTLGVLLLGGLHQHSALFSALAGKAVVGACVIGQVLAIEVQNTRDRAVQKLAVVADDQNRMRIAGQIVLEPERTFEVQVVGWFVEEQEIWFREKNRRQCHAHTPPAREGRAGHFLFVVGKTQTLEDGRGAGVRAPCVDISEAGLNVGNTGRISCSL